MLENKYNFMILLLSKFLGLQFNVRFSYHRFIEEENRTRHGLIQNYSPMESHIWDYDWYKSRWPWMALIGENVYAVTGKQKINLLELEAQRSAYVKFYWPTCLFNNSVWKKINSDIATYGLKIHACVLRWPLHRRIRKKSAESILTKSEIIL